MARTAAETGGQFAAHVDLVRRRAVASGPDGTTFYSWHDGPSVLRTIIEDRYGQDDTEHVPGELAG